MERRQDDIEEYSLTEPLRPRTSVEHAENDINYPPSGGHHLASIVEKKRLWWRNALINALFIASWCAAMSLLPATCTHSRRSCTGSYLRRCYRYTTNGCSRQIISDFQPHCLSRRCICSCSLCLPLFCDTSGRSDSGLPMTLLPRNTGKWSKSV